VRAGAGEGGAAGEGGQGGADDGGAAAGDGVRASKRKRATAEQSAAVTATSIAADVAYRAAFKLDNDLAKKIKVILAADERAAAVHDKAGMPYTRALPRLLALAVAGAPVAGAPVAGAPVAGVP
jgi:hypothetical protein